MAKIYALAAKLGWADDPKRLRAFLEKRFGASHPTFLDDKHARNWHRSDEGHAGREDAESGKEATMEKWTDRLTIDHDPRTVQAAGGDHGHPAAADAGGTVRPAPTFTSQRWTP